MRAVSLAEAKAHFSELVTQVAAGEEIVITRHGQPVARLCGVEKAKAQLVSRAQFRAQLPRLEQNSSTLIRDTCGRTSAEILPGHKFRCPIGVE